MGLMTGDVAINENAACIVMTTEILRSMLYRCPSLSGFMLGLHLCLLWTEASPQLGCHVSRCIDQSHGILGSILYKCSFFIRSYCSPPSALALAAWGPACLDSQATGASC